MTVCVCVYWAWGVSETESEKPQRHFILNIAPAAASRVRGDFSNDLHYIIPPISLQMCEFV